MSTARSSLTAVAVTLAAATAALPGSPAFTQQTTTVLELFTSQGCSSCPAADELFAQYASRPGVLALTFNVDYWDYLGWKDTLATPDNTERQREYAMGRGDGQIYTPQVVVDGHAHVIGSDKKQLDKAILANAGNLTVPITLSSSGDAITVTVPEASRPDLPHATLWLVMYNPAITVAIERGENGGRTLTYSNVVKRLRPIAMWKGNLLSVDIPMSELSHAKAPRGAVILQTEKSDGLPGVVIGAATLDFTT
jgi:hypothetical protein